MSAMQPYSGGPYADQKQLRWEIRRLKNDLSAKPMGPRTRKRVERELVDTQAKLKTLNAKIREMKKSRLQEMCKM